MILSCFSYFISREIFWIFPFLEIYKYFYFIIEESEREVDKSKGIELAEKYKTEFLETSAKLGHNVDQVNIYFFILLLFVDFET